MKKENNKSWIAAGMAGALFAGVSVRRIAPDWSKSIKAMSR